MNTYIRFQVTKHTYFRRIIILNRPCKKGVELRYGNGVNETSESSLNMVNVVYELFSFIAWHIFAPVNRKKKQLNMSGKCFV